MAYISKPSCLILLTVTCESKSRDALLASSSLILTLRTADFENQGAHHLAKQHDPNGQRTIGSYARPSCDPSSLTPPYRCTHKAGSNSRRRGGVLAALYSRGSGTSRERVVRCQATGNTGPEGRYHLGRSSGAREGLLLDKGPLVFRDGISSPFRDSQPHRGVE